MRRFSGSALGFLEWMEASAQARNIVSPECAGDLLDRDGNTRCARVLPLLPTALGPLGHLYADTGSQLGDRSRLLGGVQAL